MKTMSKAEVKRRKARLKASGHTYGDVARLAGVSWRMVKFWIDGQKTSANVERAYHTLTASVPAAKSRTEDAA